MEAAEKCGDDVENSARRSSLFELSIVLAVARIDVDAVEVRVVVIFLNGLPYLAKHILHSDSLDGIKRLRRLLCM